VGQVRTPVVVARVVAVLSPYLGDTMARSSVRAHCTRLGISEPTMTDEQADALAERLEAGLRVFLPKSRCLLVAGRLRKALEEARKQ